MNYALTLPQAIRFTKAFTDNPSEPDLEGEAFQMRNDLIRIYQQVIDNMPKNEDQRQKYYKDIHFGIEMFLYFDQKEWFNMRTAEELGFWRYVAVYLIPDLISDRWGTGENTKDRFYKSFSRIWPSQIWWFIYLTWQGSKEDTLNVLDTPRFSTDTIMNLVDRSGRCGVNVKEYRVLVNYYSQVPSYIMARYEKEHGNLFRALMRLSTARQQVLEPDLFHDGCEGYVKQLFIDLGINYDFKNNNYELD